MKKRLNRRAALALLDKYNSGNWIIRRARVACAANSGDSGWCETYVNGAGVAVLALEYPNARYRVRVYGLIA